MFERGLISQLIKDTAHRIRDIGNDMGHGDFEDADVTEHDSGLTLALMDMILAHVFQEPEKVKKLTKVREDRATGITAEEPKRVPILPITVTGSTSNG